LKEYRKNHYIDSDPEDMKDFAAFCLEKSGWKKYPDEKPEKEGFYFVVWAKDQYQTFNGHSYFDGKRFTDRASFVTPLAWMPLPEYKP